MYLSTIETQNFKGASYTHALGPLTLIVGENFSGKTAIADAIGLGLIGHDPSLGKRNSDSFKFASGVRMEIKLATDDGKLIEHVWRKDDSVSYSQTWPKGLEPFPTELLSLHQYLYETTAAQRIQSIFERIDLSGFDDQALIDKFALLSDQPHGPHSVVKPLAEKLVGQLKNSLAQRKRLNQSIPSWLASQILTWQTERKNVKRSADVAGNLIQAAQTSLRSFQEIPKERTADIAKIQAEIEALQGKLGGWREKCSTWNKSEKRRAELKSFLDQESAAQIEARLKEAEKALGRMKTPTEDNAALIGKRERLAAEYKGVGSRLLDLKAVLADLEVHRLQTAKCPCCGKKGKACKSLAKSIKAAEKRVSAQNKAISAAEADQKTIGQQGLAVKSWIEHSQNYLTAKARRNDLRVRLDAAKELEALGAQEDPRTDPNAQKIEEQISELRAKAQSLTVETEAAQKYNGYRETVKAQEAESIEKQTEASLLDWAIKMLVKTQEEMVEQGFAKILKKSRAFTDGLLESPLVYRGGELGRLDRNGAFITHEVFSGTEKLLSYAGISVALAQQAPIKIVRLDEMGRLVPWRKKAVAKRMQELIVANAIDQAILVDVDAKDYKGIYFDVVIDTDKRK